MRFLLILATAFHANVSFADVNHCRNLWEAAPDSLQQMGQLNRRSYEEEYPGAGFGVIYGTGNMRLSVFFYDDGQKRVTSEQAKSNFASGIRQIKTSLQKNDVQIGKMATFEIDRDSKDTWLAAQAQDSLGRQQSLVLGRSGNCLVKLRWTSEPNAAPDKNWLWVWDLAQSILPS